MQNVLKVLAALAVIAILGLGIGYLGTRSSKPTPPVSKPPVEPSHVQPTQPANNKPVSTTPPKTNPAAQPGAIQILPTTPETASTNAWDDAIGQIIDSETDDTNKVKELFALFPTLPAEGQEEVAEHLSNLVEDDAYQPLGRLLADPKLSEDVLDVLMSDLLNRPNATKLPMFLELAFTPDHPKAEEAKDLLELYLDDVDADAFGNDKAKWEEAMQKWLKNPDNQD